MDLEKFKEDSDLLFLENKKYLQSLQKKKNRIDESFSNTHDEVFEEVDCLTCGNCCKTTSPILTISDIDRLAKVFRQKSKDFIAEYLKLDEDNDYVLKSSPCTFLGEDNKCFVYDVRPKACREYPHTNRKKMHQILDLTLENTKVCPAVLEIVQRLKTL